MPERIIYAGDSTAQYNDYTTYPQTGLSQGLRIFIKPFVEIKSFARNGRSTKSFIAEGRLEMIEKEIKKGDIMLIQFGHNDEKLEDPNRGTHPFSDFQENLKTMIEVAKSHEAYPVLITPLSRKVYLENGKIDRNNHLEYPKAMKQVALETGVPLIDLCEKSADFLDTCEKEGVLKYYMHFDAGVYDNYPEGKSDNTHLRYEGAVLFASMIAEELKKLGGVYEKVCVSDEMTVEEKEQEQYMLRD